MILVGAFLMIAAVCELIVEAYLQEWYVAHFTRLCALALMLMVAWLVVDLVNGRVT